MNTYLDLLDTKFDIKIELMLSADAAHAMAVINGVAVFDGEVTGSQVIQHSIPLLEPISIEIQHTGVELISMQFDQWEARPQHGTNLDGVWKFYTQAPFYQWWHTATAQGWLLKPQ